MADTRKRSLSRRGMLQRGGLLTAGVALTSLTGLFGPAAAGAAGAGDPAIFTAVLDTLQLPSEVVGQLNAYSTAQADGATVGALTLLDAQDTPETMANIAATADTLAVTHYLVAVALSKAAGGPGIAFSPYELAMLISHIAREFNHLQLVKAMGGQALATRFYVRQGAYTDHDVYVQQTDDAELAFTATWIAATRRFAELGDQRMAATAAQFAAAHQANKAINRIFGARLLPHNVSLAQPVFYNVSDVLPVLHPFLAGGAGMVGPVAYPGDDKVAAFLRAVGGGRDIVVKVPPFVSVF